MVKLGLLPAFDRDYSAQTVTLTFNDSGRFEDRWVTLRINGHSPMVRCKEDCSLPVIFSFPQRFRSNEFTNQHAFTGQVGLYLIHRVIFVVDHGGNECRVGAGLDEDVLQVLRFSCAA